MGAHPLGDAGELACLIDRIVDAVHQRPFDGDSATGLLSEVDRGPDQLEQLCLNLVHNALQAMPEGGMLQVITLGAPGTISITFRDNGKGIAEGDLARILQPFFTTKHRGSGLGLPVVQRIAEAHGGNLRIHSDLGEGTAVTISIPNPEAES